MRVSTSEIFDKIKIYFQRNMFDYVKYQDRLATSKKINKPSDDPIGMSKIIDYKVNIKNIEQYTKNLDDTREFINFSEDILGAVVDNLIRAKELAIEAADDTITSEQRQYLAKEIAQIKEQVLNLANSKFRDSYVFSGFKIDNMPFDLNSFNYTGDSGKMLVFIDKTMQIAKNIPGDEIFGSGINSVFNTINNLQTGMENNDKSLIDNALGMLDIDMSRIIKARADLGARLNHLDSMESRLDNTSLGLKELLSNVEDADIAETVTELSKAQLALQALRQSSSAVIQQSLLDFLK